MNQRAHAAYADTQRETAVASARPVDLVVLVFQRMLDHLRHGRQLMLDEEDSGVPLGKALQLLNGGLEACLDADKGGEIAQNLATIYQWANREILMARVRKEHQRLTDVMDVLTTVSQAWQQLAEPGTTAPHAPGASSTTPTRTDGRAAYQMAMTGR